MPRRSKSDSTSPSSRPAPGSRGKPPAAGGGRKERFARPKQIWRIYQVARKSDPAITWWMLGAALLAVVVMVAIGFAIGHPLYFGILSVPLALLAASLVLGRRAEKAAYKSISGKPGASGAALSGLRRGWYYDKEPVAAEAPRVRNTRDVASAAMVFRAVGRPGVILVAEGPRGPAIRLAESERKKVARVAGSTVPVTVMRVGEGEDTVAVDKLSKRISKMKPILTAAEASAVNKRLRALGGFKPPVPGGMDPTRARVDRRQTRGR